MWLNLKFKKYGGGLLGMVTNLKKTSILSMSNVKILLVAEDSIKALNIKHMLESIEYEVPYVASSSEEAVENASIIMPDIILMDTSITYDNDSQINKLDIPIIYLTNNNKQPNMQKTIHKEPYNQIITPYDRNELKYAILEQVETLYSH